MTFAPATSLEQVRSLVISVLGVLTLLAIVAHTQWLSTTFPALCTSATAAWESLLTLGFWLLALLASLSVVSASYAHLAPTSRAARYAVWGVSLAAIPALLVLPSTPSVLGAATACTDTGQFYQHLTWYMMAVIAGCALITMRLFVQDSLTQRAVARTTKKQYEAAQHNLLEIDRQKSEFVAIASHQLRSPLTAVRGYVSMLLEGSFGSVPDEAKEPLERIDQSARHMAVTIEDYLNVSKIEMGALTYDISDFNLADEVLHACDDMRPRIMKDGIILLYRSNLQGKGMVKADRNKVTQIVHNLIENAHKYTKKGVITVFVRDDLKNRAIYVDVIDTGVGMSKETIMTLFQKFKRADGASKVNAGGSGLGLFVSQKMAEAMDGTILAASEGEGMGSRFTLQLPAA